MANSILELQNNVRVISAETTGKTSEFHQIASDIQLTSNKAYAVFSDQNAGQSLVMELAQAIGRVHSAAIEIGMFDVRAHQVISQLSN